ncbi:hypothetical protein WISP_49249 [Willisornis vidua]|uniref:Uncharacterized protein n=1 Tax=Willisornis vidua TaxID=1566151 RepID=A0ABQ9DE94_9PASS|nr:hypothetical protein WISP_49249 [Willisornis vidua]
MQFSILLGGSKAMSRITTLDFMRANFDLFRDLFGRIPLERANGKSGPRGIFEDHFLHTQDWCIPSPREKSGEVSEDWDKTNVTPVFKKGKKKDLGNYRPVSFTSVLRKVIEWLILEGICKRVEDKKSVTWMKGQSAFCKFADDTKLEGVAPECCAALQKDLDLLEVGGMGRGKCGILHLGKNNPMHE